MTLAVRGFFIGTLLLGGASTAGWNLDGRAAAQQVTPTRMTLTNERPEGSFEIPPEILTSPPPVLSLSITQVINPAKTPFQLFVYLSYQPSSANKRGAGPGRILIGNVGFYPPDRPAGFLLRASTAFRKLEAATSKPSEVRLLVKMERIHAAEPWSQVEVTVAPPQWRSKKTNTE